MVAAAMLSLQLDYSNLEKEPLLISLVQAGIDIYGAAKYGGANWYADGGHNTGNKMPLLLAATMLNDPDMLTFGDKQQHYIFQEDQQTFHVDQATVDTTNSLSWNPDSRDLTDEQTEAYTLADIGLAEWGIRHKDEPDRDNKHWDARYRHVASPTFVGHALTAHVMGLEDEWNWPAFFDYADRYYARQSSWASGSVNAIQLFVRDMWEVYRNDKPVAAPAPPGNFRQVF